MWVGGRQCVCVHFVQNISLQIINDIVALKRNTALKNHMISLFMLSLLNLTPG